MFVTLCMGEWARSTNLSIPNAVLCQLSYTHILIDSARRFELLMRFPLQFCRLPPSTTRTTQRFRFFCTRCRIQTHNYLSIDLIRIQGRSFSYALIGHCYVFCSQGAIRTHGSARLRQFWRLLG